VTSSTPLTFSGSATVKVKLPLSVVSEPTTT
jgi:hypothetical protein